LTNTFPLSRKGRPWSVELIVFASILLLLVIGTYSRNNLWKDEVDLWLDCVKKSPNKSRPYVNLSYAYINAGAYDRAIEASQKAIEIDPKSAHGYHNLGVIFEKRGELDKAIEMTKKSLVLDPTLHMALHSLGKMYFEKGQYQESVETFRKFLEIYPYFPEVHNVLAIIYAGQKQFDKAIVELEQEVRINPYNALAHLNLGQIYWNEFRNRQKAIQHFKIALLLDPLLPRREEIRNLVRQLEGSTG